MEKETRLVSNASDEFLQRIERQRLESECLHSLDLRASVEGPCKRFSYRGRSLWLDPDAHQLFLEGLKNNAGVFTVGTYESILERLNGESIETEQISVCGDQEAYESGSQATMATATPSPFESNWIANNLAIDLSYFEKRVYDRFKISLNMELLWNGQTYPAETRDISQSGMQLRLKMPVEVRESDQVRIAVMPSVGRQLLHPELDYRVLRIRRLLNDTLLALQCIEKEPKDGLMVISEHIAASSKATMSEQTDSEDALLTAQALLAERFYMRSTSILPFFLFEDQEIDSPLRIIFGNQVNKHSLRGFENLQGKYDFSSLVTPKRIKLLMRLAVRDSKADTLIAVYRSPDHIAPQVRADLECKNHKHWCRLLMRYIDQPGFRVFKVVARAARRPVEMRIEDAVGSLTDQDNEFVRKLLMDAKTLSIVGALIDVTEQVRDWRKGVCSQETSTVEDSIICCEDQQPLTPPQLVPICYIQENRSEDRFLGQMQVEVSIAGRIYQGETCDVSTHGLSVMMNKSGIAFESDHQATISFPKLESRSSSLTRIQGTFRNVPADIVSGAADGDRLLRFKISDVAKGRQFTNAFSNFLAKRQPDLCLETSHTLRAATSRLYSSIFVESSSTLPIFVYRRSPNDWSFRLGVTASPTPLIDYFEVTDGEFDFDLLTKHGRLKRLMREVSESGSGELTLYLSKQRRGDAPAFDIRSLADFEITDKASHRAFVRNALEHDFRCVKIIVNKPNVPPKAEIEQAIDRLVRLSSVRSERLKVDFENLIAIGDVVDVTGLVEDVWFEEPDSLSQDTLFIPSSFP